MSVLYELFKEQAGKTPHKIAVTAGNEKYSYAGVDYMIKEMAATARTYFVEGRERWVSTSFPPDVRGPVELLTASALNASVIVRPCEETMDQLRKALEEVAELHATEPPGAPHPFLLLRTSGTTGAPKLISLSQETKLKRARQFIRLYGITPEDSLLIGTPLHTSMAQRLILVGLLTGCTIRLLDGGYSPECWLAVAQQCSVVVGVPTQLQHLASSTADLSKIRLVLSSSAPRLDHDYLLSRLLERSNIAYHECYGASEVAIVSSGCGGSGSVGSIVDEAKVTIGITGEILVESTLMFDGYYGNPELTAASKTLAGQFKTGDSGFIDLGELFLEGRLSEVILVGGTTVWPAEVERVVRQMAFVEDCMAVSAKDDNLGEVVKLVVVSKEELSLRDIQRYCVGKLPAAAIPRVLSQVESLPRTELGKLQRRKA